MPLDCIPIEKWLNPQKYLRIDNILKTTLPELYLKHNLVVPSCSIFVNFPKLDLLIATASYILRYMSSYSNRVVVYMLNSQFFKKLNESN